MADIDITCPECGKVRTVSEFSDLASISCSGCGSPLKPSKKDNAPKETGPRTKKSLQVAKRGLETTAVRAEPDQNVPILEPEDEEREISGPALQKEKKTVSHAWFAAALFLVLGGLMYALRYESACRIPDLLKLSRDYGWAVMMAFHVIIVLRAMADNMLQGILCLLIPGYSFYYLFAVSDQFYARAFIGAMLIGIGQDAITSLNYYALELTSIVHAWIEKGGGDIR